MPEIKDYIGWIIAVITILITILTAKGYFSKTRRNSQSDTEPFGEQENKVLPFGNWFLKKIGIFVGLFIILFGIVWLWNPFQSLDIDQMIAEAESYQQQRKFEDAIKKWLEIKKYSKGNDNNLSARACFSIGVSYQALNEHKKAIDAFTKSIQLKPDMAVTYNNRGKSKGVLRQYKDAIKDFDKAISLDKEYAPAYSNRGNANRAVRKYKAAIADFNKAISLKPDNAHAYFNKGVAKYDLGLIDEAIPDIKKAGDIARRTGDRKLVHLTQQALRDLTKK